VCSFFEKTLTMRIFRKIEEGRIDRCNASYAMELYPLENNCPIKTNLFFYVLQLIKKLIANRVISSIYMKILKLLCSSDDILKKSAILNDGKFHFNRIGCVSLSNWNTKRFSNMFVFLIFERKDGDHITFVKLQHFGNQFCYWFSRRTITFYLIF
jgi:hypothetical protein